MEAYGDAYASLTDEELVARSHAGDSNADEALYARYKNTVRLKARPYFLVGADRDDLLQEGMIGLYKAVRDYDASRQVTFRSFAELCITRQLITAVKSASRLKHMPLNSYVSLFRSAYPVSENESERQLVEVVSPEAAGGNPEAAFISKESLDHMERDITAMLSPMEAQVLDGFVCGKSYAVIAEELSVSTKAVDNALQRIKKKMEKRFAQNSQKA